MAPDQLALDVECLQNAFMHIAREMTHPRIHERFQQWAGVNLDKVSEKVMSCLTGQDKGVELRLSDVANRLGVELSSVSRKVQKLEEAGLIARSTDPDDARAVRLQLTAQGQALLTKMLEVRRGVFSGVLEQWSPADRSTFIQLFSRFSTELTTHLGANLD